MLEKLVIRNYLLLKNIEIEFLPGFNIITGETGAGKSILINAFSLLLGDRADYSIIAKNKEKMIVEGFVKLTDSNRDLITRFMKEKEIDLFEKDQIIIRRELYSKGYSRNFINDTPVGTGELKFIGDILVDIHSQNEHQSLLRKEIHIELLDSYLSRIENLKFASKKRAYEDEYEKFIRFTTECSLLKSKREEMIKNKNFMEFQLKEINDVNPIENEEEILENELKISENIEAIQQGITTAYSNLYEDSGSITERLRVVEKELTKLSSYNSELKKVLDEISATELTINEASRTLQGLMETISHDPARIEEVRERLYKLQFLKKKYGGSLQEVLKLKESLLSDLSLVENFDEKIKEKESEIKDTENSLLVQARTLSRIRHEKSKNLETDIASVLKEVGFENATFRTDVITRKGAGDLNKNGLDDVEFLIKVNKGDEFTSLRKTASGGEISRIMLAIKTSLSEADQTGVLVFDEIDIGISGRIAQKVGRVMKKLSSGHQIIAITHLAQIAALAENHLLVEKETEGPSTITKIRSLDKNEKVIEVAKLLSGEKVTDASIKSAKELMN